jgi:aryl-alcohol dehydrogenase-like predicted oxidoreductase
MEKRRLGNSALMVTPLSLGGNVFGWTIDEKQSFRILDAFAEKGFNFIDTADVYSRWASGVGGESETIIGKWMKARNNRKDMIIATKVGFDMGEGKVGLSKKYIRSAVEDSLRRLQTDHIDLYQSHKDDEQTPLEETLATFTELIAEGKIRVIGASNYSAERLQQSIDISHTQGLAKYETLQPLYNLYDREVYEKELEGTCVKNKVSVINYYSLAAGFLTGKYRSEKDLSKSPRGRKAEQYLNERGLRILNVLDELSKEYSTVPAAIAIAWLLSKASVTAPIASATSIEQLDIIVRGTTLKLSAETLQKLDHASAWAKNPV